MNKKQIAITLGIVCFILTVAISIQLKTVQNSNSTVSQSLTENGLRDEVLRWKEQYDNAYAELTESQKTLEEIRRVATQNDTTATAKQEEITRSNMILGLVQVEGPGLEITLADNNTGMTQDGQPVLDLSTQIVHFDDLLQVVNALNNAGAEAISINEHRVIQTTAMTCEGNIIKINGERISSPFTIKAIGSTGILSGSLNMIGGPLYWMEQDGVLVDIVQSENVVVEKYNGVINYQYMKNKE